MASLHDLFRRRTRRTGGRTPPLPAPPHAWPAATEGRRVVVEHEDGAWQWAATRLLEKAGYEVASCGGPHQLPHHRCPLVSERRCPLVDHADLVINGLGIRDPANRAVLTALRARCDQIPVIITEIPAPQLADAQEEIAGYRTIPYPAAPNDLVAAVDDLLRSGGKTRND